MYDILILGGGASGFAAAIASARRIGGGRVAVIEGNDRVLKKLSLTGNGQCNLSNVNPGKYFGDEELAREVIGKITVKDTLAFFKSIGVETVVEDNGRVYPRSRQASSVSDCLRFEAAKLGISVFTNERINSIEKVGDVFEVKASGNDYLAKSLVYALGGAAYPKLLTNKNNLSLLGSFGIKSAPFVPALVQLSVDADFLKPLKGIKCDISLKILENGVKIAEGTDEIHFAGNAISGPVVFSLSPYATISLSKNRKTEGVIDFFPELSEEELFESFLMRCQIIPALSCDSFFSTVLHNSIGKVIVKAAKISFDTLVCDLSQADIKKLAHVSKNMRFGITDSFGFNFAQSSVGGILSNELDEHLMAKKVPSLYFCGEAVNVCGECGGYNLQWAWSSGILAGRSAAHAVIRRR